MRFSKFVRAMNKGGGPVVAAGTIGTPTYSEDNGPWNSPTISSVSFGTESTNRWLIFIQVSAYGGQINSMTIGGVSATKLEQVGLGTGGIQADIWAANVPTGSTGSIVLNAGASYYAAWMVIPVYGDLTVIDSAKDGSNTNDLTLNLDVTGADLVVFGTSDRGGDTTIVTGVNGQASDYHQNLSIRSESGNYRDGCAGYQTTNLGTGGENFQAIVNTADTHNGCVVSLSL